MRAAFAVLIRGIRVSPNREFTTRPLLLVSFLGEVNDGERYLRGLGFPEEFSSAPVGFRNSCSDPVCSPPTGRRPVYVPDALEIDKNLISSQLILWNHNL